MNRQIILSFAILSSFGSSHAALPCAQVGECLGARFITEERAKSPEKCSALCQGLEECDWFTFYSADFQCFLFQGDCEEITTDFCSDCFSGDSTCVPPTCWVQGVQVVGSYAGHVKLRSPEACHMACKENERCVWYTLDQTKEACTFLSDKESFFPCENCHSGESACATKEEWDRVLIVGGVDTLGAEGDELLEVEAIDLAYNSSTCDRNIPNFPNYIKGSVGTFIDGAPLACGGTFDNDNNYCWRLNGEIKAWENVTKYPYNATRYMGSALFDEDQWWISGGLSRDLEGDNHVLDLSVIYIGNGYFAPGPTLPRPLFSHCVAKINATHYFVGGGMKREHSGPESPIRDATNEAWILNWKDQFSNYHWQKLDNMPLYRYGHFCHYNKGTNEVIVGAGRAGTFSEDKIRNTTILDLDTLEWREGVKYPRGYDFFLYPAYLETDSGFATFGGDDKYAGYMNSIGFFDDELDDYYDIWTKSLHQTRSGASAIRVPDKYALCEPR